MQCQSIHLIYFSPTHTTQTILRSIGKGSSLPILEHDFTLPQNRLCVPTFDTKQLVVIGVPVYYGRLPLITLDYINALKGNQTPCVIVGVYGNRHYDDCLAELYDIMERNGFLIIAGGAFIGEHSLSCAIASNRPNEKDIDIAIQFGKQITDKLNSKNSLSSFNSSFIPGNRPYKEISPMPVIAPIVNENCIDCFFCAQHCPSGAISFKNVKEIDASKCIKCRTCAKNCPQNAIDFTQPPFLQLIKHCENTFTQPYKTPELFGIEL